MIFLLADPYVWCYIISILNGKANIISCEIVNVIVNMTANGIANRIPHSLANGAFNSVANSITIGNTMHS